jgi:SAM-dependent methyltransferase
VSTPTIHDTGNTWLQWLHDRKAHREPVDAHFDQAIAWLADAFRGHLTIGPPIPEPITITHRVDVLEIGPADQFDMRDKLMALPGDLTGVAWSAVEIGGKANEAEGVVDISVDWEEHMSIPFEDESMDAIFAREVFEHVYQLGPMLAECLRILRPGGRLWFSAPFTFPLHDVDTGDYWRITPKGWFRLLTDVGFGPVEVWPARYLFDNWQTPISVLGWAERG